MFTTSIKSRRSLSPMKPKGCCARSLTFYEDFVILGSPKRDLEAYNEDESVQGEPETKRIRHSDVVKPVECLQCGRLFGSNKRLKQHQRLHTADAVLMTWLDQGTS